jgi:hypothetical protein
MDYTISLAANGNEVTTWNFPEPACGDFAECHAEPPTCACPEDEDPAYLAYLAEMERTCGRSVTLGPAHDPYGATCELDTNHSGPHRSPDPFGGEGFYEWTGGGTCAGDPLPIRDGRFVQ